MLDRDPTGFHKGLTALHPGENSRMVCAVLLCKIAQKIHAIASIPLEERYRIISPVSAHLYQDLSSRFTTEGIDALWQRFLALDAALQTDEAHLVGGARSVSTT